LPWSRAFDDPIKPPKGKPLVTLKDAAAYIIALPKSQQQAPEWQAATEALLMAAEDRGPLPHTHVGMMLALQARCRSRNTMLRRWSIFAWEGDLATLDSVEADLLPSLEHGAAESGIPRAGAKDLLYNAVRHLSNNGHFTTNEPWLEQQCVLSYLLSRPTTHPQHPGRFRDYISVWDFSFNIKPTPDGSFEIQTLGSFELGLVQ
jgi:hypothetical protein